SLPDDVRFGTPASQPILTSEKVVSEVPQAMDDFFCNFLVRLGMSRTLDCFQTEWYELTERGVISVDDAGLVPPVYTLNQKLESENLRLKKDIENYKQSVTKTEQALIKMQKERDFHRMHHKRVVQEKDRLISDMKRLKAHYASYEPMLKELSERYQNTLTLKMLTSLERDKAVGQVKLKKEFEGPTQKALREARQQKFQVVASSPSDAAKEAEKKMGKKDVKVHKALCSCSDIVLTGGDDRLWKTWAFPDGNILLTGEGHTDWLSGCCFRPSGTQLVTSSGDTTVRIWDLSRRGCILTLRGHSRAVHDCSWHTCGEFVASASMDGTSKIWDVNSEKCRYTLRGHKEAVNSIEFLPFSSTALTSSADKTVSLWDARTVSSLCLGHVHSCNHATFNKKGDTIASCDSSGVMKIWDVRKLIPILSIDAGPHSANQVSFHRSGRVFKQLFLPKTWFILKSNLSLVLKTDNMCEAA
uniref:Sperm associated antigen 16 n=1 Tax=Malurus cyaneus samueli TaxID=2593467 RepID=A0A8C5UEG7_9PASS